MSFEVNTDELLRASITLGSYISDYFRPLSVALGEIANDLSRVIGEGAGERLLAREIEKCQEDLVLEGTIVEDLSDVLAEVVHTYEETESMNEQTLRLSMAEADVGLEQRSLYDVTFGSAFSASYDPRVGVEAAECTRQLFDRVVKPL